MSQRTVLVRRVERAIEHLSRGLSPSDMACGWSEKSRVAMLALFEDLLDKLRSPEPLPRKYRRLNIARNMDFLGITAGELLEEAAEISGDLENTE